jgi:FtsP/CotA-like multicopper oxidase with cupredoxin domain
MKAYTALPGDGSPNPYNTPNADGAIGGNPAVTPFLLDGATPPSPNEAGWKDTVVMMPGQVTRVAVRWAPQATAISSVSPGTNLYSFDPTATMGQTDFAGYPGGPGYVWHCHILDHEDNEMMRPYMVVP